MSSYSQLTAIYFLMFSQKKSHGLCSLNRKLEMSEGLKRKVSKTFGILRPTFRNSQQLHLYHHCVNRKNSTCEGKCRSTTARLVYSPSLSRRTNQVRRQQTRNSRLKISYTYITLFSSFAHEWYVVVTYQPLAQICISNKRYVVVTYCSIISTSRKKHVFYTCNSVEVIEIGTE